MAYIVYKPSIMKSKFTHPTRRVNDDVAPDRLTLGTAALGGVWGPVNETESINAILLALEKKVRVFDTAPAYSRAEEFLGKALKEWKGERPIISSKVGRLPGLTADNGSYDYSQEALKTSLKRSLGLLNVDYLDIVFLHDMENCPVEQRLPALECLSEMKQNGLVKNIGLGGRLDINWYQYVDKQYIDVVMNYNRLDAANIDGMFFDIPLYKRENIMFYAGSILHMGLLGRRFDDVTKNPPIWITDKDVKNAIRANEIAKKYDMSLSTLAHRFAFSIAETDRVVIGARNEAQLKETLKDWDLGILPEEIFNELVQGIL
jgi:aryl-alcohol dehydrogenase-like predicted oxidoreductase